AFLERNTDATRRSDVTSTHGATAAQVRRWRLSLRPQNSWSASTVAYSSTRCQSFARSALLRVLMPTLTSTRPGCAAPLSPRATSARAKPASESVISAISHGPIRLKLSPLKLGMVSPQRPNDGVERMAETLGCVLINGWDIDEPRK